MPVEKRRCQLVNRSIKECDGELLSELVAAALKDSHVFNGAAELACQVILDSPYDEMLAAHIRDLPVL
uniref:Uncharacterized protein n=1 Tax=Amphimedon queenslandica TaxID=400682 RepID=A0A1X7T4W4_AMPQE